MTGTDYTVRSVVRRPLSEHLFTVVDRRGQIHHVTVNDRAVNAGLVDQLVRDTIAAQPSRPEIIE